MGLFRFLAASKWASVYEETLRNLGVNPRLLPPKLHAYVNSTAESFGARTCRGIKLVGKAEQEHMWTSMVNAGYWVAVCTKGPSVAPHRAKEMLEDLAEDFGTDGSEQLIISAVEEMVGLHPDFRRACLEAAKRSRRAE